MAQRSLQFCGRWSLRVNSLWLWWYCILVLAAEGYLVYRAVNSCRQYNELPWSTTEKPVSELYAYICLIVLSVMCMPFFVITSVFKVGCYSNDGTRLGRDNVLHHVNVESPDGLSEKRGRFLRDVWRHAGPLAQWFHIISAFTLLLPRPIVEAQQIRFGFLKPEKMWASELEGLYGDTDYEIKTDPFSLDSNNTGAFYSVRPTSMVLESGPVVVSPEFVNYVIALVVYGIRYAAVYWYTSAAFSFCFTAILILTALQHAYAFCGLQILYKFAVNEHAVKSLDMLLSNGAVLALYIFAAAISFITPITLFNYGYCQYVTACRSFLQRHFPTYARYVAKMPVGCNDYVPHIFATSSLVCFVALRGPIVYDYVNVYRSTGFPILLTCIVIDVLYMVAWIALWFGLTIKQTWLFQINPQMDMLPSIQRAATIAVTASTTPSNRATTPPSRIDTTHQCNGDSNNNSREIVSQPTRQQNSVQVIDRPPPYTSKENLQQQAKQNDNTHDPIRARKQLPPLVIETREAQICRDTSPNRNRSPERVSPNVRHISPDRNNSPVRQATSSGDVGYQINRQRSPGRHDSPNRYDLAKTPPSPQRHHSPARQGGSPERRQSPERSIPSSPRHQSPSRQISYPSSVDTLDTDDGTPNTPVSPATSALKKSGLRKSGERRSNVHQRVTFDESVNHLGVANPKLVTNSAVQLSPNASQKRGTPLQNVVHKDSHFVTSQDLDVLPVVQNSTASGYTGSTPDNTLTRNYRSSIRDKCGEYYKHLGDMGIPPAAQSSPIPHPQMRPLSDNYDGREVLLNPLTISGDKQQKSLPQHYSHLAQAQSQKQANNHSRNTSETELSNYYENGRFSEQNARRPHTSGRKSYLDDDRCYSYPSSQQRANDNAQNYQANNHQRTVEYSEDRQPTDLSSQSRPNQRHARDISHEIAQDLNKHFSPINKSHQYLAMSLTISNSQQTGNSSKQSLELNREIKIIKPDLNRRDSALPSSNETSSNDSADNVLCSQV